MSVDLVVSAYKDRLDWVELLRERSGLRLFVYDKNDKEARLCRAGAIPLLNVGKCDHTYLHHIAERYDDLADWTMFSTDCPHDGLPAGIDIAGGLVPGESVTCPWVCRARDWDAGTGRIRWEAMTNRPDRNGTTWSERWAKGLIKPAELSFVDWAKKFTGYDPSGDWPGYHPGALYGVPKKAITYLPREFYARLRDQLAHHREPEEGHYMERLWLAVFAGKAKYEGGV